MRALGSVWELDALEIALESLAKQITSPGGRLVLTIVQVLTNSVGSRCREHGSLSRSGVMRSLKVVLSRPAPAVARLAARAASVHHDLVSQFCFAENVTHFHRDLARSLRLEFEIVNLTRVHSHRGVA